jgi:rhodanese-related sulfurtransferase
MKTKLIIAIIMAITISTGVNGQQVIPVSSTEAIKMIEADKKLVVLDVRTPGEFSQGHIKGAVNIDVSRPDAGEQYKKLDPNFKYMVICRTKNRSGVVTGFLVQNGFKTVYQVTDGIVGWAANGLALVK